VREREREKKKKKRRNRKKEVEKELRRYPKPSAGFHTSPHGQCFPLVLHNPLFPL